MLCAHLMHGLPEACFVFFPNIPGAWMLADPRDRERLLELADFTQWKWLNGYQFSLVLLRVSHHNHFFSFWEA